MCVCVWVGGHDHSIICFKCVSYEWPTMFYMRRDICMCVLDVICTICNEITWEWSEYSKTSDNGHSNKRTTSLQWTNCLPPAINCPYISTSDEGTTSEQWTKCSSPMCPLFRGSTVYYYSYRTKEKSCYPFKLSVVGKDGLSCATCPWHK